MDALQLLLNHDMPHLLAGLLALGMSLIFFAADPRSGSNRSLMIWMGSLGIAILLPPIRQAELLQLSDAGWSLVIASLESIGAFAGVDWILRVRRTATERKSLLLIGEVLLRIAQVCVLAYWVMHFIFPGLPQPRFDLILQEPSAAFNKSFWLCGVLLLTALALSFIAVFLTYLGKPSRSERVRMNTMILATPFLLFLTVAPPHWMWLTPLTTVIGVLIFISGSIAHLILLGHQDQFMGRFLSPQVAKLLRTHGLEQALKPSQLDISVVACDLRGFTAYARHKDSAEVLGLLGEYYDTVGNICTTYGGTVKDHAGDGVLMLIGAPVPFANHADRAVALAKEIVEQVQPLLEKHACQNFPLGIGCGVASGLTSVGAIGGKTRLEYTAVGTVVNLAARLCDKASNSETLACQATIDSLQTPREVTVNQFREVSLKGFDNSLRVISL